MVTRAEYSCLSGSMQADSSIQATIAAVLDILMMMAKKKKGKKVRVAFRRNRTQPARDKSWTRQFNEHGFENTDTVKRESLIPKGDMSRKRTIIEDEDTSHLNLREGRAIATRGLIIDVDDGERVWPCTVLRILLTRLIDERHPVAV